MASRATSGLTVRGFDSISLCPRSSSLRTRIASVSLVRKQCSTHYTSSNALRCRTTSRKLGIRIMCTNSSGSGLEEIAKKTIGEYPVVVYSKTWCSYSSEVKSLFKRLGVEPYVIELDQLGPQGPELQKTLETLTGQCTVPNVFIGGKHIGGCTDDSEMSISLAQNSLCNWLRQMLCFDTYKMLMHSQYCKATSEWGARVFAIRSWCHKVREVALAQGLISIHSSVSTLLL